jgi:hypothetical protein
MNTEKGNNLTESIGLSYYDAGFIKGLNDNLRLIGQGPAARDTNLNELFQKKQKILPVEGHHGLKLLFYAEWLGAAGVKEDVALIGQALEHTNTLGTTGYEYLAQVRQRYEANAKRDGEYLAAESVADQAALYEHVATAKAMEPWYRNYAIGLHALAAGTSCRYPGLASGGDRLFWLIDYRLMDQSLSTRR